MKRARKSRSAVSFREAIRSSVDEHGLELPMGNELAEGWLTQFGTDWFREQPRFESEFDVSALLGKLSLSEAIYASLGRPPGPKHRIRVFDVVRLVVHNYRCLHTPSSRNPQHASILAGCGHCDDIEIHRAWWSDPGRTPLRSLVEEGGE
ncbi:hypothetical protein SEA_MASK_91 [Mycobacterium phage Mask]|nr:hypothetical protein SEA_SEJANUS_93 [Mycobacterium phage Sejanus]UVT31628.1 hypothetical protein SEA_MASK_91 [Mycobacterium phage Mask]